MGLINVFTCGGWCVYQLVINIRHTIDCEHESGSYYTVMIYFYLSIGVYLLLICVALGFMLAGAIMGG